jgi:SSS family transporter
VNPLLVGSLLTGYFLILIFVAYLTGRSATTETFFTANRKSPWFVVAFGMIGTTISGVTFISVPGEVGNSAFTYFEFVMGNFVGYMIVAFVLLPVYYRMNLISIYSYLEERLGFYSYKSGSFFFILSRTIGAAFRMYLVAEVLQLAFFAHFGIPFGVTVLISIILIWIYTTKGGVKTIIWTDSLQTIFLISAVVLTIYFIFRSFGWSFGDMISKVADSPHSKVFDWNWKSGTFFFKQFLAGIFITIVMSGLDQDMMQKNLTCKNLKEAQKNMVTFSVIFVGVVWMFLTLGALLYIYAESHQIALPRKSDDLYPLLAINQMSLMIGIFFLLGITAANYASADSALTSLTTAFCIDFLNFSKRKDQGKRKILKITHLGFSLLLLIVILVFKAVNNQSVVMAVFKVAGLTYGPLLGLFSFGMLTRYRIKDRLVPIVVVAAPMITWLLNHFSIQMFNGYQIGFELVIINGALTFIGLFMIRTQEEIKTR